MSQTLSPSLARCYGMARVARVAEHDRRVGACSDAELAEHIRQHVAASRLYGEGYRKLWARLRFAGVRTRPRRVRRVMRENGLLAPQAESGPSAIPAPHPLGAGINCLRSAKIDSSSSARASWGNQQCGNENKGRSAIEETRIGMPSWPKTATNQNS
jgi:HTH-like domain